MSRLPSARVYAIFLLSGMAALVYQVIWARWLGLIFGNTTTSVSIILAAFMLGLALGSRIAGRATHRVADPMRAYALLELGIGAFALAFPWLAAGLDHVYAVLVSDASPAWATIGWRAALALLLLLVPTSLMGATLPLLTEWFRRAPGHGRTWKVGVLYAANTIGAALGVIAASFFGIELLGIRATTIAAALLNFAVAGAGFALAGRAGATASASATPAAPAPQAVAALVALALSGALALASEVLWTRALQILVGNSTYAFATILVVYLVGVALGSAGFARVVKRSRSLDLWMLALLLGMGGWTTLASEAFELLQARLTAGGPTQVGAADLLVQYAWAATILLPLALLSGALFPVCTRLIEPEAEDAGGEGIARAYVWNTVGAVVGSLVAGFVVAAHFDYFQAIDVLSAAYVAAALCVGAALAASRERRALATALLAVALLLAGLGTVRASRQSRFLDDLEQIAKGWEVRFHRPGLQGVTTALARRGEPLASALLVNANGMTAKTTDTKIMAHLPMLIHPKPERVLVICFGMGTTFRSALSHGARVTAAELVGEVVDAFGAFHADAESVRQRPEGNVVVTDGRNFLRLTRERFDVITIDPPPPIDSAGVTSLYSFEFVALARERLAPGGILAHWIPFPGTRSGIESVETFRMLLRTLVDAFPHVRVVPSLNRVGLHVLASDAPIVVDPARVAERLADPAVAADLGEWQPVPPEFFRSQMRRPEALDLVIGRDGAALRISGAGLEGVPILTDDRPRLEFDLLEALRTGRTKDRPGRRGG